MSNPGGGYENPYNRKRPPAPLPETPNRQRQHSQPPPRYYHNTPRRAAATATAVVTPNERTKQGCWCEERTQAQRVVCSCFKARKPQKCQSCNEDVNEGDCIQNQRGVGWVHVKCQNDEHRTRRSLQMEFLPQRTAHTPLLLQRPPNASEAKQGDQNQIVVARDLTPSLHGQELTKEQQDVVDYASRNGETIRINALAGCGKTTTLAWLCHSLCDRLGGPRAKILYVVFGKQAQEEASKSCRFPKNVEILTSHALAKRRLFPPHLHFKPANAFPQNHVVETLGLERIVQNRFPGVERKNVENICSAIALIVINTVTQFQYSKSETVNESFVPSAATFRPGTSERQAWKEKVTTDEYVGWATEYFSTILRCCMNPPNDIIAHDSYLKVFHLVMLYGHRRSTPHARTIFDQYLCRLFEKVDHRNIHYDALLVDEAQDLTHCQADVLWGRRVMAANARIYLVGDEHQRVFGFRGASDSFEQTVVHQEFPLQGTFRFGPKIAEPANVVLSCCSSTGARLKGLAAEQGVVAHQDSIENGVVICRTRIGMYRYLERYQPERWAFYNKRDKMIISNAALLRLQDFLRPQIQKWRGDGEEQETQDEVPETGVGEPAQTFNYRNIIFTTMKDLVDFCREGDDTSMLNKIFLLHDFHKHRRGTCISELTERIQESWVPDWSADIDAAVGEANINRFNGIIFITLHGSKGLQFDNVLVHNDFQYNFLLNNLQDGTFTNSSNFVREQAHFIYVAMTRAKKKLCFCQDAVRFIQELRKARIPYSAVSTQQLRKAEIPYSTASTQASTQESVDLTDSRSELEKSWAEFVADPTSRISSLEDVPWPTGQGDNVFCLDCFMSLEERRSVIKAALIRYHPDKFLSRYGKRISSAALTQAINNKLEYFTSKAADLWKRLPQEEEALL